MLILLDCRPLQTAGLDSEKSRLVLSVVSALSGNPGVQWLLVAGHTGPVPQVTGTSLVTQRVIPGNLGWRLWYDLQIPRLAKKHNADLVMTTGGIAARTELPQCLWMPDRVNPKEGRGRLPPLYASRLGDSLRRAGTVFCYSGRDRDWLAARDAQAAEKIAVLHPSPDPAMTPLSITEREQAKAEFAQGREYFFADAAKAGEEGVIHLLKAFSLFKKRQHSNLQLVIRGIAAEGLQKKLETYKYREDVHWCPPSAEKTHHLIAGAYAGLLLFEANSGPVLDAWQAGVPIIVQTGGLLHELAGEAALAADGSDPASLAAHLMSVYKDETLRSRLIDQGLSRVREFGAGREVNAVRAVIDNNCPIKL